MIRKFFDLKSFLSESLAFSTVNVLEIEQTRATVCESKFPFSKQ